MTFGQIAYARFVNVISPSPLLMGWKIFTRRKSQKIKSQKEKKRIKSGRQLILTGVGISMKIQEFITNYFRKRLNKL